VPSNLRLQLALYDANLGYMWVQSSASADGDPVTLTYNNASGIYYLRVKDLDRDRAPGETYQLSVSGADLSYQPPSTPATAESEPNNAFSTANFVGTDPVSGSLDGNADWFRFHVGEASELTIHLAVPGANRSVVQVYDAGKNKLAERQAENKGDSSTVSLAVSTPGDYYVCVYDADGASSSDPYSLDIDLLAVPDAGEPNGNYADATPLPLETPVQGAVFPKGDHDWFVLEITEPGTLTLDVANAPANIEPGLKLYDQNGNLIGSHQTMHDGEPVRYVANLKSPGFYRVEVFDGGDDEYATTLYTIEASFVPDNDTNEPNDLFRDATELSASNQTAGMILPAGDVDWFKFHTVAPKTVYIQVARTEGILPHVELYNDSKGRLASVTAQNVGDSLLLSYYVPEGDTYYILVRDRDNNRVSTVPYLLTVNGGEFDEYSPVAGLPGFSPNPVLVGQPVRLTATGSDEDGLVVGYEWKSDIDGLLGTSATLELSSLSAGRHRVSLRIRDDDGNWSAPIARSLVVAPEIGQEAEYNNSWQTACPVEMDRWTVGHIDPANDVDFYKVYVGSCGRLRVLLDALPAIMRPKLDAYDENGNSIWASATASIDGAWLMLGFYVSPGWYHVRVADADGQATGAQSYAVRFSFYTEADPYEPNDSLATATEIEPDSVLSDPAICPNGEYDHYRLELPGAGRLSLELRDFPDTMKGAMYLYNESLDYMWISADSLNPGDPVPLVYDSNGPGVVYVRVKNNLNAAEPQPYEFVSQFTPAPDAFEPNNSAGEAVLVTQSANHGYIFPINDEDWFRVWMDEGETLSLSVTETPSGMRAGIAMYNGNWNFLWIHQEANNPGDNVYLNYTAPADGMYYFRIKDEAHGSYVTPYLLTVGGVTLGQEPPFAPQTVEAENNGSWAEATDIALSTNVSGQITPNGDEDYFRVQINQPGVLVVSHTGIPEEVTSEMWVYNPAHGQIGYRRTTNPGEDNILEVPATTPGMHFIRIKDFQNNNSSSELYNLHVTHTPVIDPHEPNNSSGTAFTMGAATVSGYLFAGSDEDWYRFYVRNPGPVSISLDAVPAVNRPHIYLLDANKNGHGDWVNTNPGVGGSDLIVYDVPAPGFYYLRVRDEDGHYGADPYTLRVGGADFSSAPLLAEIGDRTLTETVAYSFIVTATDPDNPEDLVFSATNLPSGATFDPATRTFSWTPARGEAGTYAGVRFEVSDGTYTDAEEITLTVNALDRPPELDPIGDKSVFAESELRFQISATDPDPGTTLTYEADNLPSGASFDGATRTFAWTPGTNQIGTWRNILFRVTDGERTDFEYIDVEVAQRQDTYDSWLDDHFTEEEQNNPDLAGPDADPDGDGATNMEEYEADTDPRDRNSLLHVTSLAPDATGVQLQWQGGSAATQYVERKFSLDDPTWEVIQTIQPPTPATNSLHIPFGAESKAFYRIRAQRE